ncbi:MAG: alpha/beta hydrolase [Chloroflexi bacterium]|nr:alpha/beta hydrolase [Chloroflexota bacterium]
MSVLVLQDEIVHYEVLGRGRPLIFLHGWVGSWRYWVPAMQAASASYRAYALDFWGYGESSRNTSLYSLENQTSLLGDFMDQMGVVKSVLVGHGLGAIAALQFACQNLDRVDRLMLTALPGPSQPLPARLRRGSMDALVDWLLGKSPERQVERTESLRADERALQRALQAVEQLDLASLAFRLQRPCLLVYGQNDPLGEPGTPDLASLLPGHFHQVFFEQSGHFPMLDEPAKFNRLLADFLALNSAESLQQLQLKEEWKRRVR